MLTADAGGFRLVLCFVLFIKSLWQWSQRYLDHVTQWWSVLCRNRISENNQKTCFSKLLSSLSHCLFCLNPRAFHLKWCFLEAGCWLRTCSQMLWDWFFWNCDTFHTSTGRKCMCTSHVNMISCSAGNKNRAIKKQFHWWVRREYSSSVIYTQYFLSRNSGLHDSVVNKTLTDEHRNKQ